MQTRSRTMWRELTEWEKDNNAICFIVVSTEELRESLSYYPAFDVESIDTNDSEFICNINHVSEKLVMDALRWTYNSIQLDYGINYESINELCYEYIVDKLMDDTRGLKAGNIWNSETKTFEKVTDFLDRLGDNNAN